MQKFKFNVLADYKQFEVRDAVATGDLSSAWTEQAVKELIAIVPGAIGIGTARNSYVPVELFILDSPPTENDLVWDQIVECGIEISSGRLQIIDGESYLGNIKEVEVDSGAYRVRVYYGELGSVSVDGLDGKDFYRIIIWKNSIDNSIRLIKPGKR